MLFEEVQLILHEVVMMMTLSIDDEQLVPTEQSEKPQLLSLLMLILQLKISSLLLCDLEYETTFQTKE